MILSLFLFSRNGCVAISPQDMPIGCFEYYLNRYQTIIASMIALIAAISAVMPAFDQLHELRKQSSWTASEKLDEMIKALDRELNSITSFSDELLDALRGTYDLSTQSDIIARIYDTNTKNMRDIMVDGQKKSLWSTKMPTARLGLLEAIQKADRIGNEAGRAVALGDETVSSVNSKIWGEIERGVINYRSTAGDELDRLRFLRGTFVDQAFN